MHASYPENKDIGMLFEYRVREPEGHLRLGNGSQLNDCDVLTILLHEKFSFERIHLICSTKEVVGLEEGQKFHVVS